MALSLRIEFDGALYHVTSVVVGSSVKLDSAEKPSVHPSRASEPVLSLSKERTVERLKSLGMFRSTDPSTGSGLKAVEGACPEAPRRVEV